MPEEEEEEERKQLSASVSLLVGPLRRKRMEFGKGAASTLSAGGKRDHRSPLVLIYSPLRPAFFPASLALIAFFCCSGKETRERESAGPFPSDGGATDRRPSSLISAGGKRGKGKKGGKNPGWGSELGCGLLGLGSGVEGLSPSLYFPLATLI